MSNNGKENNNIDNLSVTCEPSPTKKLRSCEPDLKVVLSGNVVRWYPVATLASKSNYVDAMLASPMKERQNMVVEFPDIGADVWDSMMKFVEDPSAARKMNVQDAIKVAQMYDKYDFSQGRQLCDDVLEEYTDKVEHEETTKPPDLDMIIDVASVAKDGNLDKAKQAAMKYICSKMSSVELPYGRTMFTERHLEKLVPLLTEEGSWNNLRFWTKDEIRKPSFPSQFVSRSENWLTHRYLHGLISHIELSGSGCKADGKFSRDDFCVVHYEANRIAKWGGVRCKFDITLKDDGWAIVRKTLPGVLEDGEPDYDSVVETVCWMSPHSVNLPLPPKDNWKSVDPLARGEPRIEYIPNGLE